MQTTHKKKGNFGKVVAKVSITPKVEIHIRKGAKSRNGPSTYIGKYVKTNSYTGPARGGFMIPETAWPAFKAAVNKVD